MVWIDPDEAFRGVMLVVAPHMDDEVLGCGGTIARVKEKELVHIAYATDGAMSPVPTFSWQGSICPDLPEIRRREARSALAVLGVPNANLHFFDLPDGQLNHYLDELRLALATLVAEVAPDTILIPFRYDRHSDHLALHLAMMDVYPSMQKQVRLIEYFVYYRWRLLSGRDLREYLRAEQLVKVDIRPCSVLKNEALKCFRSQTTRFFTWQVRPILTSERIAEVSEAPELFLEYDPAFAGPKVFSSSSLWIRAVHRIEPPLKTIKERALALLQVGRSNNGRSTD